MLSGITPLYCNLPSSFVRDNEEPLVREGGGQRLRPHQHDVAVVLLAAPGRVDTVSTQVRESFHKIRKKPILLVACCFHTHESIKNYATNIVKILSKYR